MAAYTNPQQRKKEESERLRGERDQIKLIDLSASMHNCIYLHLQGLKLHFEKMKFHITR